MELTLALAAGAPTTEAPAAPGTDPADATSEAFAALLATLVAGVLPIQPTPEVALPEEVATTAGTEPAGIPAPAIALLPATIALPAPIATGAPTAPEPDIDGEPVATPIDAPIVDDGFGALLAEQVPVAEAEVAELAELPPTNFEAPTPVAAEEPELDVEGPKARPATTPTPAATATVLPEAVQAVAPPAATFDAPVDADPTSIAAVSSHPAAHVPTPAAREILRPEIVSGPGARPAPATPTEQVVKAVLPLRHFADGTHKVVLELHPAELGAVRVELALDRGIVHLGLRADVEGTSQLLRAALPELRSQLDAAGLTAGRVAVDTGQGGRRDQPTWEGPTARRTASSEDGPGEEPIRTAYSSAAHGHVDVLL